MIHFDNKPLLARHPNFKITTLDEASLRAELSGWSRADIIAWLEWNDPNGVYADRASMREFGAVLTVEEGVEVVVTQLT
jgi:hypothetical protein